MVVGDTREATDLVQALAGRLPGMRGVYAGRLRNARQVEALTINLVSVNRRYKAHAGIRITDVLAHCDPPGQHRGRSRPRLPPPAAGGRCPGSVAGPEAPAGTDQQRLNAVAGRLLVAVTSGGRQSNECSGPGKTPPRTSSAYSWAARSSSAAQVGVLLHELRHAGRR